MPDTPIPGVRVDMPDDRVRQTINDRQWQPGQSKSTWTALTGHSVNSAGQAFKSFYTSAWNTIDQTKAKVFASATEAKQASSETLRAQNTKQQRSRQKRGPGDETIPSSVRAPEGQPGKDSKSPQIYHKPSMISFQMLLT